METKPITEGEKEVEQVEPNEIFIGRIFADEEEAYHTYTVCIIKRVWNTERQDLEVPYESKSDTRLVCNKDGQKLRYKRQEGQNVQCRREIRCDCPVMIEIVLNNVSEQLLVKYIAEHNHPLSTTPSKSKMHRSHATAYRTNVVRSFVQSLNSEGVGLQICSRWLVGTKHNSTSMC